MKFAKTFKRFSETKATNKLIAVLVVLAVIVIGVYLIVAHAATPYVAVTADSGTRSSSTTQLVSSTSATDGKHYVKFDTGTTTTSGGPPALPTGPQTVNGITFTSTYTTTFRGTTPAGSTSTPPTDTYWFGGTPGAGVDANWPGDLAVVNNGLALTTEDQSGVIDSGGIGVTSALAQTPPAMADWTEEFGGSVTNLVRYMLWWPESNSNWPADQEFDMLEGNPASPTQFHMTWHGNNPTPSTCPKPNVASSCDNVTVGHLPESGIDTTNQWYAFRSIWVAGTNGYIELLAGPNFNSLTEVDEITAAQISSQQGGALIDTTPHVADWAVEAEGSIDTSELPLVDNMGGFQLYE